MNVATISKWGNASGIRLPKSICMEFGLEIGSKVTVEAGRDVILIKPQKSDYSLQARKAAWDGRRYQVEDPWGEDVGSEVLD